MLRGRGGRWDLAYWLLQLLYFIDRMERTNGDIPSQAVMKTIGSIRELAYQTNKGIWAYRRRWHMV